MKLFSDYWEKIADENLMGKTKTGILFDELMKTETLDGALCEIGCFKGHTSKLMHLVFPEKKLEIYDTFEGIQGADPSIDMHVNGEFSRSLDEVKNFIGENENRVSYFVGFFPDSYEKSSETKYAFVHSDTDTYIGTKSTLEVLWPRMLAGGVIVFDDYHWPNCPGVEKAVHEWLADAENVLVRKYTHQIALEKKVS